MPPMIPSETDFVECDPCSKKPGMPVLCDRCLHNRHAINALKNEQSFILKAYWELKRGFRFNQIMWIICATVGALGMFVLGLFWSK